MLWAAARLMVVRDLGGYMAHGTAQEANLIEDGDETGAEVWRIIRARVALVIEPQGRA